MIDLVYLDANTINQKLKQAIIDDPAYIQSLIDYATSKILLYIVCTDIFYDAETDSNIYPDDIQMVCVFLVEMLFVQQSAGGNDEAIQDQANGIKSKRIDDFAVTYSGEATTNLFYGIPILPEYQEILDKYRCDDLPMWFFTVN